jgi:hypothetical protein
MVASLDTGRRIGFDYDRDFPPLPSRKKLSPPSQEKTVSNPSAPSALNNPTSPLSATRGDLHLQTASSASPIVADRGLVGFNNIIPKVCSIAGRVLNSADIGLYIVRPQPSYRGPFGQLDMSCVPCQGMEGFFETRLIEIKESGKLVVQSRDGCNTEAWFANDGRWLPVEELKAHLALTGEVLYKSTRYRDGGMF